MNPITRLARTIKQGTPSTSRSAKLSEQLQELIFKGELVVGASLPSERELMVKFNASRSTVREALRTLGAQGLIEVKRGRKGGSYVCAPNGDALSKSLDLFIKGHDIRFVDLLAAREAIEPVAAAQAAIYRTKSDLEILYYVSKTCELTINDLDEFSKLNVDWHMAVIRASHNSLFEAFMLSISPALFAATDREEFDLETRKVVAKAHWHIYEAISKGDRDAARRRMARHISAYGEQLSVDP